MATQTILIIRHAEKPDGASRGIDDTGAEDSKSLTPRGWQRAGAWAEFFAPARDCAAAIPTPTTIFAAAPESRKETKASNDGSKSRRPLQTVSPLARKLKLAPDLRFSKGDEEAVADAAAKNGGIVLICWQHEDIARISAALRPRPDGVPTDWPDSRFNVILRFDRDDNASQWVFHQVIPVLLGDDPRNAI